MRIFNLAIVLLPLLEAATPVNLHLDATFASPPFLLELLEAAATEKPECYFQLIPHLVSLPRNTDRELYNAALPLISSCLGDPASVELFKLSVSLRSATPKIEAVYQYYDHSEIEKPPCDSWFLIEGTGLCELPKNMPESSRKDRKLLRMDRIYPTLNHEKPAVIYYADLTDPTFLDHHESLIALSRQNKIRYVLRYKSPKIRSVRKVSLSGYGVEMALKKMDYLVIDDREDGGEPRSLPGKDESTSTIQPLRISELAQLGPKAISYIINSENPLNKLLETSRNLPSLTSVLSKYNSSSKVIQEIDKLNGHAYPPGQNMLWINGRQIDSADITIYSLLQFLRYERDMISSLSSLGLSTVKSRDLLTNPAIATYYETISSQRFDFRDSVIIYFNNIENDKLYASWSQSLSTFLTPIYPGQLHTVRRNFHTLVVSINLSDDDEVNGILGRLWSIVQRKIALRIGIILETDTPRSRAFVWIYQEKGLDKALEFLSNVLPDNTSDKKAFENVVGRWGKPKFDDAIVSQNVNDHFSKNNDWLSRFSFQHGGVFFNGRFIQKSDVFPCGYIAEIDI
ncbi:UDP-glucose:glycoprotein glucosyltransferase [Neolecta irregularis DAH-3]|uniref:UDP-glucose:glycoprotein glucosyltransferase n=1 Tax=Neolecta irregularis (strain DAH-3) TaxID=1198029 RepID=A0A1U7LPB7_NEOID|nr:UDP-glucose:glycoprotein glucosyltransferase [Neolecta irregularis DAH-3]|eukprot:OLL24479.1 UDP-glucose:glycoprotein glucosyltransferase [Neolecta irregularis DAH-3]